jgi:prepilin-type N-terminal cleavage/methylation domain-containing protein
VAGEYLPRRDSADGYVGGGDIPHAIEERVMKFKKSGFTLVEILVGVAVGGLVITGMLASAMSYLKIWEMVSGSANKESFNREAVTRRFLANVLSPLFMGLDNVRGHAGLTFRKLNGSPAIYGDDGVCLYWESVNELPFIGDDKGGMTQCWLVYKVARDGTAAAPDELRLYYRSLPPDKGPSYSGGDGEPNDFIKLLDRCKGVNFGYTSITGNAIAWYSTPLFSNGKDPDLPELVQILVDDNPVT